MSWALIPTFTMCIKCKQIKNVLEFHKSPINKTGRRYECKKCSASYQRRRTTKSPPYARTEKELKEAPYIALVRLAKLNPECFIAAVNKDRYNYERFLNEERERLALLQQQREQLYKLRNKDKGNKRGRPTQQVS